MTNPQEALSAEKKLQLLAKQIRTMSFEDVVREWNDASGMLCIAAVQEWKYRPKKWWEYIIGKDRSILWDALLVGQTAKFVAEARKSSLYDSAQ